MVHSVQIEGRLLQGVEWRQGNLRDPRMPRPGNLQSAALAGPPWVRHAPLRVHRAPVVLAGGQVVVLAGVRVVAPADARVVAPAGVQVVALAGVQVVAPAGARVAGQAERHVATGSAVATAGQRRAVRSAALELPLPPGRLAPSPSRRRWW